MEIACVWISLPILNVKIEKAFWLYIFVNKGLQPGNLLVSGTEKLGIQV